MNSEDLAREAKEREGLRRVEKLEKDIMLLTRSMVRFWVWTVNADRDVATADPCPLCEVYAVVGKGCGECPIRRDGHDHCRNTPYLDRRYRPTTLQRGWNEGQSYVASSDGGPRPQGMTCADAAAEIVYLAGLRDRLMVELRSLEGMERKAQRDLLAKAKARDAVGSEGEADEGAVTRVRNVEDAVCELRARVARLTEAFLGYVGPPYYNRYHRLDEDLRAARVEMHIGKGESLL